MSKSSVPEIGPYVQCSRCRTLRPPARLKLQDAYGMECDDRALCDALLARNAGDRIGQITSVGPPDWDQVPDPPLIRRTEYHSARRGLIADVSVSNGHNKKNGRSR